ncbi:DUF2577 domain-containing protein [Lysinibacillus sp. LZ02]|uniref:DUF2577 domain-containing protein n=1 Tax=Lysinibacillus sp. LZ02 TaxID=3420668 RepID=UPI003D362E72
MSDFIKSIRKIVLAAIEAQKLTRVVYGTVDSLMPLRIRVDQKLVLEKEQLILTRAVTTYDTEIRIAGGSRQYCTIYNELKVGDKVTMIRQHGGQQYLVIDKEVA